MISHSVDGVNERAFDGRKKLLLVLTPAQAQASCLLLLSSTLSTKDQWHLDVGERTVRLGAQCQREEQPSRVVGSLDLSANDYFLPVSRLRAFLVVNSSQMLLACPSAEY